VVEPVPPTLSAVYRTVQLPARSLETGADISKPDTLVAPETSSPHPSTTAISDEESSGVSNRIVTPEGAWWTVSPRPGSESTYWGPGV
jgi:hypothetical protein